MKIRGPPYGRVFLFCHAYFFWIGLKGNPLAAEVMSIYNGKNGTAKLLSYMLDNLVSEYCMFMLHLINSNKKLKTVCVVM